MNLLYGDISWDQIYLAIVIWALELMENKYRQLRQHMKFNLMPWKGSVTWVET